MNFIQTDADGQMSRIVFIADIPQDYALKQRPQYLAEEMAKMHDVQYVCPTIRLHPHSRFRAIRVLSRLLGSIPGVHWLVSWVQYGRYFRHRRPDWVFTQSVQFVGLVRLLQPRHLWFDLIDNPWGFGWLPKHCQRDFLWLQEHADVVSATCPELLDILHTRHDVLIIPNGVNLLAYRNLYRSLYMP